MKEFLKMCLIEPFQEGGILDYILGLVSWFLAIFIIGLLLWFSIWLVDSSYLPTKEKEGVVTNKYYTPEHTTTNIIMVGKVWIPTIQHYDAEYEIEITIDGLTDNVSLYYNYWNKVKVGDTWCCKYTNGRILKSLYIKSFCNK